MNKLIEELQNKEKELQRLKMNLEKSLQTAPEGKLRITHKKETPLYYHRTQFHKSDQNYYGSYIKKENMTLVQNLAQKDYEEKLLKVINEQLPYLQQFLQNFHLSSLSEVYEHMSKDRKALVNAHVLSDESFAKMWQEKPYVSKGFAVNDPEIYTEKNERVRSKSEKILADKFFTKGIPYKYECPLNLNGYGTVYPDFTLLNKKTRAVFFWEHLGMMDNSAYAEKALLKIESYEKNSIYPGKQLILTHETASRPLNIKIVESLIEEFLI